MKNTMIATIEFKPRLKLIPVNEYNNIPGDRVLWVFEWLFFNIIFMKEHHN